MSTPIKLVLHLSGIVGTFLLPYAIRFGDPLIIISAGALLITYAAVHTRLLLQTLHKKRGLQRADFQFTLGEMVASLTIVSIVCSIFSFNFGYLSEADGRQSVRQIVLIFLLIWTIVACAGGVVFRTNTKSVFRVPAVTSAILSGLAICYNCFELFVTK